MTLVTKTIRGQKYLYLQDSVKVNKKSKIITTFVARTDSEAQELLDAKKLASAKHFIKITRETMGIEKRSYKFESIDVNNEENQFLNDAFESVKSLYHNSIKILPEEDLDVFQNALFTRYVYGTTAIEGSTLSEDETFRLLAADLTPKNKTINETISVANYNAMKEYMDGYTGPVTESLIKRIHQLLMIGVRGHNGKLLNAGEYRQGQVILNGIGFRPPPAESVSSQIRYLIKDYENKINDNVHPIEAASIFHQKFEEIHPFQDGNGRAGREILNYMLTKEGYPPIYVTPKQRSEYLSALQEGNTENFKVMVSFILLRIEASLFYLYSKTRLYEMMFSEKIFQDVEVTGMEEAMENTIEKIRKLHNSEDLP